MPFLSKAQMKKCFATDGFGGSESIVTCKDKNNPNFQIWGAMSDLGCNKKKKRKFKSFKDWLILKNNKK